MEEVKEQKEALATELEAKEEVTEEELTEAEEKVEALEEEERKLNAEAELRAQTLREVADGKVGEEIESSEEERKEDENMNEVNYRSAYFKKLMRKELTEEEQRALSTSTTATIPVETSDRIFDKMVKLVPLMNEIELFHINGSLKFAVETTRANAGYHTENSTGINADATAVLTTVTLNGYEFTKLIQVSGAMLKMSIEAFEDWLIDMLAASIATKVEYEIINGSGTNAVKGIDKADTWVDGTNAVQYVASTGLTADEVREAIGYLPAGYDNGAKFLMNKKTLFTQFMGLQDSAKHDLISVEGNRYYVYGYEVIISDEVSNNVAYLGNFKKYVGNFAQDIEVKNSFDIDTNSYKFLGVCVFDGEPACADAFVKIATSL